MVKESVSRQETHTRETLLSGKILARIISNRLFPHKIIKLESRSSTPELGFFGMQRIQSRLCQA